MKTISYTEYRILKDILDEMSKGRVNIREYSNKECIEFGINWSASGTQSIEETENFIAQLNEMTTIAKRINALKLIVNYEDREIFETEEEYLKRKTEIVEKYL